MARHIRKDDTVIVTAGNNKGSVGKVVDINVEDDTVIVQGVNIRTRHLKPTQKRQQGGIVQQEMPIHISNVSPMADGKATRVRFETHEDGSKVRVAARNGDVLHTLRGPRKK